MKTTQFAGLLCPADNSHGALTESETKRLYCPHQAHDGRPKSHPEGETEPTPCFFSLDAVEAGQPKVEA